MITHHQQSFFETAGELLNAERAHLSALIGQRITDAWIATEPDGTWFNDEPAVICVGDIQLEIAVYQVGLLAMTWNTIDLSGPANWLGCWNMDDDHYRWHRATHRPFVDAIGQSIQRIHVADRQSGVDAIQFTHDAGVLVLYNAGDELGVSDEALDPKEYLLHPIAA